MWAIPERQDRAELLDLGVGTTQDVKANFADLSRINRYLGGVHSLTHYVYPALYLLQQSVAASTHKPVVLVDIGTGSAEIPLTLENWARHQRIGLRVYALDLSTRNLTLASEVTAGRPDIGLLQADALQLPIAPESCDIVTSSLFLHHLSPEKVIEVLRAAFRCARHALIMSDLVRGRLPLFAFWLVQPIFARNFLTRNDGMVSILRAYTPDELLSLAQEAGLTNAAVHAHWPWRMTLVAYK